MILTNFHTHTNLCDGKNTPEEMVESAIESGFYALGFSGHGYVYFDKGTMNIKNMAAYPNIILNLKKEYKDKIDIYLGLENDFCQMHPVEPYDYTLGAVHNVPIDGSYYCVDESHETLKKAIEKMPAKKGIDFANVYYKEVIRFSKEKRADIFAHFDLVKKFNKGNMYFDENGDDYKNMALNALHAVIKAGMLLEVNTGGMARGYRNSPYPSQFILEQALALKAGVIVNSDAHEREKLNYAFDEAEQLLKKVGFKTRFEYKDKGFVEVEL